MTYVVTDLASVVATLAGYRSNAEAARVVKQAVERVGSPDAHYSFLDDALEIEAPSLEAAQDIWDRIWAHVKAQVNGSKGLSQAA